mmetsp:Transcript_9119/g.13440  ORF Transcript_9119/g.13440 Transcript_9119/m.13440 type:complete len:256 (-) Transcript_9119:7-774(-)
MEMRGLKCPTSNHRVEMQQHLHSKLPFPTQQRVLRSSAPPHSTIKSTSRTTCGIFLTRPLNSVATANLETGTATSRWANRPIAPPMLRKVASIFGLSLPNLLPQTVSTTASQMFLLMVFLLLSILLPLPKTTATYVSLLTVSVQNIGTRPSPTNRTAQPRWTAALLKSRLERSSSALSSRRPKASQCTLMIRISSLLAATPKQGTLGSRGSRKRSMTSPGQLATARTAQGCTSSATACLLPHLSACSTSRTAPPP